MAKIKSLEMVKKNQGRWNPLENSLFSQARKRDLSWKEIAAFIGTRTANQCRSHNQKLKLLTFNNKKSTLTMYSAHRINKSTQYEPQLIDLASQPVFLSIFEEKTDDTLSISDDFLGCDFLFQP